MTTTANSVELVQGLFEAFGRGDIPYILERVSPDCRWSSPGEGLPYAGTVTGSAGAAMFFEKLGASEEVTHFEPREFFAKGDDVVVLGYEECRARLTGKTMSTNWAMVFRIRDGMVVGWESFFDTAAYLRAHQG